MPLTAAPTLYSENLILRSHMAQDIEPMIAFLTDPVRAKGFGGYSNRHDAWRWVALSVGHWHIRGYGYFTPTREFRRGGVVCRDYTEVTYRNGRQYTNSGTACRETSGHWRFD